MKLFSILQVVVASSGSADNHIQCQVRYSTGFHNEDCVKDF